MKKILSSVALLGLVTSANAAMDVGMKVGFLSGSQDYNNSAIMGPEVEGHFLFGEAFKMGLGFAAKQQIGLGYSASLIAAYEVIPNLTVDASVGYAMVEMGKAPSPYEKYKVVGMGAEYSAGVKYKLLGDWGVYATVGANSVSDTTFNRSANQSYFTIGILYEQRQGIALPVRKTSQVMDETEAQEPQVVEEPKPAEKTRNR
ncbi:MAG: hypothetical protein KU37_06365 [Sulfuricurvum sp. PC08-66]|nr:MAG: hypothetical protein KU37_06365 [Sulfuricurvum sp. PC08-66]